MCVWWMLRDMLGDAALKKAIAAYRPEQDKDPSYMPHLIAAQTQRDLEWFFDDWVYRDRGLPDFKVESAFSRKALSGPSCSRSRSDNLGSAGAEVPVIVKFAGGDVIQAHGGSRQEQSDHPRRDSGSPAGNRRQRWQRPRERHDEQHVQGSANQISPTESRRHQNNPCQICAACKLPDES